MLECESVPLLFKISFSPIWAVSIPTTMAASCSFPKALGVMDMPSMSISSPHIVSLTEIRRPVPDSSRSSSLIFEMAGIAPFGEYAIPLALIRATWEKSLFSWSWLKKAVRFAVSESSVSDRVLTTVRIWENWLSMLVVKWLLTCVVISWRYTSLILVTVSWVSFW